MSAWATQVGVVMFLAMIVLMAVRMPIAAAMFIPGALGYWAINNEMALFNLLKGSAVARLTVYELSVIPLFLLMGNFATQGGLSRDLFRAASALMGHVRGGLAMAAILSAAAFGAVCGSSVATSATITQVAYPEMKAHGYMGRLSTATLATGGTLGILIPPSVPLVVYAILTEQNIAKLFMAAFVPGIIAAIGYMVVIGIIAVLAFIIFTPWVQTAQGTGSVIAYDPRDRQQNISALVPGRLDRWFVTDGAQVKAGDPIITLDDRDLIAQLQVQLASVTAAEATAERAEDAAQRWTGLKDSGAVSAGDLLGYQVTAKEARARVALAKAQVAQTKVMLDRLVVRSPIDATVLQVSVRVGEFVAAGLKAPVVLGDISRLQIRCDLDEQLAPRMAAGLSAKGYLKGESGRVGSESRAIPLKFVRIEPYVIPKVSLTGGSAERVDTRVLQVIYQFDRPSDRPIFVGQQMDIYIDTTSNVPRK